MSGPAERTCEMIEVQRDSGIEIECRKLAVYRSKYGDIAICADCFDDLDEDIAADYQMTREAR